MDKADEFEDAYKHRTQVRARRQTIELLTYDPDFKLWAEKVRQRFGIPPKGFRGRSQRYRTWEKKLNKKEWEFKLSTIHEQYTKLNDNYHPYISDFIKFNRINPKAIFEQGYKVPGKPKQAKIMVEISFPLSNKEWSSLQEDVERQFRILGVPLRPAVIKDLEIKSLSIEKKEPVRVLNDIEREETDYELVARQFGSTMSKKAMQNLAKTLPEQRRAMNFLLKDRLGKVS